MPPSPCSPLPQTRRCLTELAPKDRAPPREVPSARLAARLAVRLAARLAARLAVRLAVLLAALLGGCARSPAPEPAPRVGAAEFRSAVKTLSDTIVHDIFSPVVAARVYVYPLVASYEVMRKGSPERYRSLSGQLRDLPEIPSAPRAGVDYSLAALHAFFEVSAQLTFTERGLRSAQRSALERAQRTLDAATYQASLAYGEQVSQIIQAWAAADLYSKTRTLPKYTVQEDPGTWRPTPPDYMDGIEPHWHRIRPMALRSSDQFRPDVSPQYDLLAGSHFHKELMEVYEVSQHLTKEQIAIAKFWDCNPYATHHEGHAPLVLKKITPGGHWIAITSLASAQAGLDLPRTIEAFTRVSLALFDAFLTCWDEKWHSLVVRPETVLQQSIDPAWVPLLQTPPFPEYPSGHSVVSAAAAATLTALLGDSFAFVDTSEQEFGLPARSFSSFEVAAEEAAMSRLYGGIHYRAAIVDGVVMGREVARWHSSRVITRAPAEARSP